MVALSENNHAQQQETEKQFQKYVCICFCKIKTALGCWNNHVKIWRLKEWHDGESKSSAIFFQKWTTLLSPAVNIGSKLNLCFRSDSKFLLLYYCLACFEHHMLWCSRAVQWCFHTACWHTVAVYHYTSGH